MCQTHGGRYARPCPGRLDRAEPRARPTRVDRRDRGVCAHGAPGRKTRVFSWSARCCAVVVSMALLAGCAAAPGGLASSTPHTWRLANQPMAACTISGEVPVKASVAGLLRHAAGARGSVEPVGPADRAAGRRRAGGRGRRRSRTRSSPSPAAPATRARRSSPGSRAVRGRPRHPRHRARRPARDRRVEPAHPAGHARHVRAVGRGGRRAPLGLGEGAASPRSMPTRASTRAASRPTTSTPSGPPSGTSRIDLYGTSYGGELAQYYLRQHADHVRVADPGRHDAARRAGPGAHGGHQPARARPPARAVRQRCGLPRRLPEPRDRVVDTRGGVRARASTVTDPNTGDDGRGRPRDRSGPPSTTRS